MPEGVGWVHVASLPIFNIVRGECTSLGEREKERERERERDRETETLCLVFLISAPLSKKSHPPSPSWFSGEHLIHFLSPVFLKILPHYRN